VRGAAQHDQSYVDNDERVNLPRLSQNSQFDVVSGRTDVPELYGAHNIIDHMVFDQENGERKDGLKSFPVYKCDTGRGKLRNTFARRVVRI
jgi:hypothetical protein